MVLDKGQGAYIWWQLAKYQSEAGYHMVRNGARTRSSQTGFCSRPTLEITH
jgi:hypothetical protein